MGTLPTPSDMLTPRPNFKVDLAGAKKVTTVQDPREQGKLGHFFKGNNADSTAKQDAG